MESMVTILVFLALFVSQLTHNGVNGQVGSSAEIHQDGGCAYTFIVPKENLPNYSQSSLSEISEKLDNLQIHLNQLQVSMGVEPSIPVNEQTQDVNIYPEVEEQPQDTKVYPKDCYHAYMLNGSHLTNGVYIIQPEDYPEPFPVYCEETDGDVWNIIQRRQDGSVAFDNEWTTYKYGFGYITGEHWLGNERIFSLVNRGRYKLRVDLEDWNRNTAYAEYDLFQIGNEESKYTLQLGEYSGNASDSFGYHNGKKFSTKDQDNDDSSACCGCTTGSFGAAGWWFGNCIDANLNGRYYHGGIKNSRGITWAYWYNNRYSFKKAVMKVAKFHPH